MNTALRRAAVDSIEMLAEISACTIFFMAISIFIKLALYTNAFMLDIKNVFTQVDRLNYAKAPELAMIQHCKEVIDLHERVYR